MALYIFNNADEPTGDLDTNNTHKVIDLLHQLNNDEQMTMIMVTHDEYLKNFCHRIIYMRDGKVERIEKVPKRKREHALELLQGQLAKQVAVCHSLLKRKEFNASTSTSRIEANVEVHVKVKQNVGTITEIREPADYETYSSNCGIPPKISISHLIQTFKVEFLERAGINISDLF